MAILAPAPYAATVLPDSVLKAAPQPEITAAKYVAVRAVADANAFRAPRVLSVTGSIRLERLDDIESLRSAYLLHHATGSVDALRLIEAAGAVLGRLHAQMPASSQAWTPAPTFARALNAYGWSEDWKILHHAPLHGDFSFANVFVHGPSGQIAVLDPCPNGGSTFGAWEQGPAVLDLGKFLACLEGQVPPRHLLVLSRIRTENLQRGFLKAYEQASGISVDRPAAFAFAYAAATTQFRRRGPLKQAVKTAVLYNPMRFNYPLARKLRAMG